MWVYHNIIITILSTIKNKLEYLEKVFPLISKSERNSFYINSWYIEMIE